MSKAKPQNLWHLTRKRMMDLDISPAELARRLPALNRATIYNLNSGGNDRAVKLSTLAAVWQELGLTLSVQQEASK